MSSSSLIRWSGMILLLSGVVFIVSMALHPSGEGAEYVSDARWAPSHYLGIVWALLAVFGIAGIYARHARDLGWNGLIGFALAMGGTVMLAGVNLFAAAAGPPLADHAPHLLEPGSPLLSSLEPVLALSIVAWLVGNTLFFGVSGARLGVMPRGGCLLIIAGTVLVSGAEGLLPWPLVIAGALMLGAGSVWIGYGLWSERDVAARQPAAALATE